MAPTGTSSKPTLWDAGGGEGKAMVVGITSSGLISNFPDVLAASLPGILVALLTFWLTTRRENAQARQGRVNARALLALEMEVDILPLPSGRGFPPSREGFPASLGLPHSGSYGPSPGVLPRAHRPT